jgi:hypothetical protein
MNCDNAPGPRVPGSAAPPCDDHESTRSLKASQERQEATKLSLDMDTVADGATQPKRDWI